MKPSLILMDIEGTTTSVSFVFDVLFPFFLKNFRQEILSRPYDPEIRLQMESVKQTVREESGQAITDEGVLDVLEKWVISDRKHTALKALQGIVWKKGYDSGELKSHVYDDVIPMLKKWKAAGIELAIYSSGSIAAQKMLYAHTPEGDVTGILKAYFDTTSGPKRDRKSYKAIAAILGMQPLGILFLSDVEEELDAASLAGMLTTQIVRAGTKAGNRHKVSGDFYEVERNWE